MTTKLVTAAKKAVRAWCATQGKPAQQIRHVQPRAYVVGLAAPQCLIVSAPWQDAEPQCRDFNRKYPLNVLHTFDKSLNAGMWCATAYVVRPGCSETVAVQFDK